MNDYLYEPYILFGKHYRTWDPHLCQWGNFDKIPDACVYGSHGDLLTQMYNNFPNSLMRYLLDLYLYYVVMYFHDLYFVLMMFGRMQYKQWGPGIAWFQFWEQQEIWEIESPLEKVIVIRVV